MFLPFVPSRVLYSSSLIDLIPGSDITHSPAGFRAITLPSLAFNSAAVRAVPSAFLTVSNASCRSVLISSHSVSSVPGLPTSILSKPAGSANPEPPVLAGLSTLEATSIEITSLELWIHWKSPGPISAPIHNS